MTFKLVFHIFHSSPEENLSMAQILSQVQILNDFFSGKVNDQNIGIPEEFRPLQAKPQFRFCLASTDPSGNPTEGITRHFISDLSLACKREFGMRSIMHRTLGGVDPWDPTQYINVYVINRIQCPALGEAVFPWKARYDEDGIILHYRAVGFTGTAADFYPFQVGKTLVHELGHYFGLFHLSNGLKNCTGDDLVADTPTQSEEYFGCPQTPVITCGQTNMYMNFMSLVNDDCLHFFTIGQVERMNAMILQYRQGLDIGSCKVNDGDSLQRLNWIYDNRHWMIFHPEHKNWTAEILLFDAMGRLIWKEDSKTATYRFIPYAHHAMIPGIFYAILHNNSEKKRFILVTP